MKLKELIKIFQKIEKEHGGEIPVRVYLFDYEDDEPTHMIKDCYASDFTVRHLYTNKKAENKETPCVILQLDNRDDTEKTIFHH